MLCNFGNMAVNIPSCGVEVKEVGAKLDETLAGWSDAVSA